MPSRLIALLHPLRVHEASRKHSEPTTIHRPTYNENRSPNDTIFTQRPTSYAIPVKTHRLNSADRSVKAPRNGPGRRELISPNLGECQNPGCDKLYTSTARGGLHSISSSPLTALLTFDLPGARRLSIDSETLTNSQTELSLRPR